MSSKQNPATPAKTASLSGKVNVNSVTDSERFRATLGFTTTVITSSEEENPSLHSMTKVLQTKVNDRDHSTTKDDVIRPPPHRDKPPTRRSDVSYIISSFREETIRQLTIQSMVLHKQFQSRITPSLHLALDQVRLLSQGVPISKYPLSDRIKDTLSIASLPIGSYTYVLLQLRELTIFRRHSWLQQDSLITEAESQPTTCQLQDQALPLHSTANESLLSDHDCRSVEADDFDVSDDEYMTDDSVTMDSYS